MKSTQPQSTYTESECGAAPLRAPSNEITRFACCADIICTCASPTHKHTHTGVSMCYCAYAGVMCCLLMKKHKSERERVCLIANTVCDRNTVSLGFD